MNDQPIVTINQLSFRFDGDLQMAIENFSCSLPRGQMIGICGPDGSGKTTLLRIIAGLIRCEPNQVIVDGFDLAKEKTIPEDLLRYMPQKFGLYEDLTVMENLELYADLNCLTSEQKNEQFKKLLDFTKLEPFQKRLAKDLSGGMKQKLGLACTLLKKPNLLLLDEPTVGVDPVSRKELWQMIHHLMEDHMTVIYSTSYLDEVEHFQHVIVLNEGVCLYNGDPKKIIEPIKNRVFKISNLKILKRQAITEILNHPMVLDGLILGEAIRVLLKKEHDEKVKEFLKSYGDIFEEPPHFEDAFLDLIPKISKHQSPISGFYPQFTLENKPLVKALNLTKKFQNFIAVDEVNFEVKQGEVFGLLGPNGAGKSTTFKMLCGLLKPTAGSATIKDLSLLKAPHLARAKIGYMAQKFSLYGNMTVKQNLDFFYGIYPKYEQKNHVIEEMIELFYLDSYLKTKASDLPLGFKQRLSLACAIMHRPEILFLDEPTSGVDPITRREFWGHINSLVSKNVAIIVTTHFMDEAEYCDRIGIVNQGKLIVCGTPDELKAKASQIQGQSLNLEEAFITFTQGNL
jgi:ABC-2 type transport system ATP-binding protein